MSMASRTRTLWIALVLSALASAGRGQDAPPAAQVEGPPLVGAVAATAPSAAPPTAPIAPSALVPPALPEPPPVEPFIVHGVAVDVTAANVAEARERALIQGRVAAFRRLAERMLAHDTMQRLTLPAAPQVIDMIQEFSIANERSSALRYLAELTVRFDPGAVRTYFRAQGVPFAETASRAMLVLPVVQPDPAAPAQLWAEEDSWRAAWARNLPRDGLIPLILPLGDLADIGLLTPEQLAARDENALGRIATRYGAAGVIVAALAPDAGGAWTVTLDEWRSNGVTWNGQAMGGPADPSSVAALATFASQAIVAIEDAWKSRNMLQFGQGGRLTALVPLTGLQDWLRIKTLLAQVPVIERVDLQAISKTTAQTVITYAGDETQLQFAVGQYGLDLARDGEMWLMRLGAGTRVLPPPSPASVAAPAAE
jgi:hypothetical protein